MALVSESSSESDVIYDVSSLSFSVPHKDIFKKTCTFTVPHYDAGGDYMRITTCIIPNLLRLRTIPAYGMLSNSLFALPGSCSIRTGDHSHAVIQLPPSSVALLAKFSPLCK